MIAAIRSIWAVASPAEKFILGIIPFTTVWDVLNGNWIDLVVGTVFFCWIVLDIRKDLGLLDREQDNG